MNDVEILRGNHRFLALNGDFAKILQGEWRDHDHVVKGLTVKQFHDDVGTIDIDASVVNGDDVRMIDRAESLGFLDEPLAGAFFVREVLVRQKPLDRNFPVQVLIVSTVNRTDAPLAQFSFDLVAVFAHNECKFHCRHDSSRCNVKK